MSIPLMEYAPVSQNQRVLGYEIPGDEQPRIYTTEGLRTASELDELILAAYRQVFNEQQLIQSNRQTELESKLKAGKITVKGFIRGLVTSETFRTLNFDVNNNYRFVEMCINRLLGRNVYGDREKMAWSIVLATRGLHGFIDELLNSEEYTTTFGDSVVPYQRRRILPQRDRGELPFARMARYGEDYRDQLPTPTLLSNQFERFNFQRFMQQTNWPVVSGVLLLTLLLIMFMLGFSLAQVP